VDLTIKDLQIKNTSKKGISLDDNLTVVNGKMEAGGLGLKPGKKLTLAGNFEWAGGKITGGQRVGELAPSKVVVENGAVLTIKSSIPGGNDPVRDLLRPTTLQLATTLQIAEGGKVSLQLGQLYLIGGKIENYGDFTADGNPNATHVVRPPVTPKTENLR
jgi:hypothetical protein